MIFLIVSIIAAWVIGLAATPFLERETRYNIVVSLGLITYGIGLLVSACFIASVVS